MSLGKIYSYANNWRVQRVQAVAALSGTSVEEVVIDMAKTKEPEFLAKFPLGYVPAFEAVDGTTLFETAAIAEYVARKSGSKLIPADVAAAAEVSAWVAFADQEVSVPLGALNGMIAGYVPYNKPIYTALISKIQRRLEALDKFLQARTFLVGDRITLADVSVAAVLYSGFTGHLDASVRKTIPNVVRFFETVVKSPKLASIYGEIAYSATAPQYQAAKKEEKPKAAAAPAAPKAPKAKKAAEDDDDEEPLVPAEPKAKNPLDDLPKSSFKMDDWKRVYSNEDTKTAAIPWFYENFDKEGWSVWRVDFKYNDELTQVFMSSNLIGGFFNRLEASRKYAMGSMGVFGKSNDSLISGVMVVRGQDFKPVMDVAPDWESYAFTKLDLEKADDKAFFEGALLWEMEVEGKPFADGKIFK